MGYACEHWQTGLSGELSAITCEIAFSVASSPRWAKAGTYRESRISSGSLPLGLSPSVPHLHSKPSFSEETERYLVGSDITPQQLCSYKRGAVG